MIRDPAGILGRIQELEPLCADPGIRRAVESGDPFKVYRALWWARRTGKLVAHRRTLDLLLKSRRAFAKPLKGKLFLGTFNTIGATLLGSAEEEPDGTRIATHQVVVLLAVPLFPLGAYVVAGGERKGLSSSWNVFARVPLSPLAWIWSRGIALALVAAVVWAGASAFWASRHHDVTVVNGLEVAVRATIGGASKEVLPGGLVTMNVPVGTQRAVATNRAGTEIESFDLAVAAKGKTVVLWNVAGAAPVYDDVVEYYAGTPPANHQGPKPTLHCGDRSFEVPSVDFAFQPAPEKISMPKGSSIVIRRHLGIVSGLELPAAEWCANMLLAEGRDVDALRVLVGRGASGGWKQDQALLALRLSATLGPSERERVARAVRAALPDDVLVERYYQDALEAAGKGAEVAADYRRRAEGAPDSPTAQYLYLRLLDGAAQHDGVEAALARFPKDGNLLRLATVLRSEAGENAAAVESYRTLRAISVEQAAQVLEEATISLVALGRRDEARTEIAALFEALPPRLREEPASLYARVAALDRAAAPDTLVKKLEEKGPEPLLRKRAGLPVPAAKADAEPRVVPALYDLVVKDPSAALEKLKTLPPVVGFQLDRGAWSLLFCEAARIGSPLEKLLVGLGPPRHLDVLRRYVRGESGIALPRLPYDLRSAASFVRSRNGALPAEERAALVAAARDADPLATYVTEAIARWPAAAR